MTKLYTLACIMLLYACQKSSLIQDNFDNEKTLVLNFKASEFSTTQTKGFDDIDDLDIFIFDESGEKLHHRHIDTYDNSDVHFVIPTSQYSIAVIANTDEEFNSITSLDEIETIRVGLDNEALSYFATGVSTEAPDNASGSATYQTIELRRTYAKVTTLLDFTNLNEGVTITPTRISLHTTPTDCLLLLDNQLTKDDSFTDEGDYITENLTATSHALATPLYTLENMQGTNGDSNTSPQDKEPSAEAEGLCTYLEVETTHESEAGTRTVTYRYYLGANTYNDFNVERNSWYKVSINFSGNGAVEENTWRVNLDNFTTEYISIPSTGQRSYCFALGNSHSSYITNYDDSPVNWRILSSTSYLHCDEDFTDLTPVYLGNLSTNGTKMEFYRIPESESVIITDITSLLFPKNSNFGATNYRITKFINLHCDSDIAEGYTVSSSEEWIYFGEGDTFKAFESTGGTSNSPTSDMYNKNSGYISLKNFPNRNIAVRCSENTTSETRGGYIKFHDKDTKCIALVYIGQNPSTYPSSPSHLTYIPGEYYMPGAWDRSCNLESSDQRYEYNSTTKFYAYESPFYISTTEATTLEFCDFLNDLGITSSDELLNKSFPALDKSGSIENDYLGLLPPDGQTSSFEYDQNTTLTYEGGLWQPRDVYSYKDEYSIYSLPLSASNYPIDHVSMFTAADYNYWVTDHASLGFCRDSDPLLITELEWEAAARCINCEGGWYISYLNGLYPYSVCSSSDNTSLYSNLITSTPDSTIKKFAWQCAEITSGAIYGYANVVKYPVGILLPNFSGAFDTGGNVREWCYDIANSETSMPYDYESIITDEWYAGTDETDYAKRIYRGGSAQESPHTMCVTYRDGVEPNTTDESIGIRLVIR